MQTPSHSFLERELKQSSLFYHTAAALFLETSLEYLGSYMGQDIILVSCEVLQFIGILSKIEQLSLPPLAMNSSFQCLYLTMI